MNQRSDIDRLLRHWMDDGPSTMPDRVVDVVADRISVQRQLRSWRLLRRLPMNPLFKLGAAAAAALVVAVIGWNLLRGPIGPGGEASPTPSPLPTQAQSSPSPSGPIDLLEGLLSGGRYRLQPLDEVPSLLVLADVPPGWSGAGSWVLVGPTTEEPPTGIAVAILGATGLYSDPCHWDVDGSGLGQPGDVEVGPSVSDLVDALQASTAYTTTTPSPVTFGDYEGWEIEIQLPADLKLATCDKDFEGIGRYFVFAGPDAGVYAQGDGTDRDRWHLFIVDVGGTRVIVNILSFPDTPIADLEAARAIVDSMVFTQ
jgi:hypothetical protein